MLWTYTRLSLQARLSLRAVSPVVVPIHPCLHPCPALIVLPVHPHLILIIAVRANSIIKICGYSVILFLNPEF